MKKYEETEFNFEVWMHLGLCQIWVPQSHITASDSMTSLARIGRGKSANNPWVKALWAVKKACEEAITSEEIWEWREDSEGSGHFSSQRTVCRCVYLCFTTHTFILLTLMDLPFVLIFFHKSIIRDLPYPPGRVKYGSTFFCIPFSLLLTVFPVANMFPW